MKTFGRKTIYANYTEVELLSGTNQEVELKVLDIIKNAVPIHQRNRNEIKYLQKYLYGDQDIKNKQKLTRPDINNKGVENWAWAFQDWKKAFLLGKPIQYSPKDDTANKEITTLNNYVIYEEKDQLDQDIYEDIFTVGRGYRYVNSSPINDEDEAPIELLNLDVTETEVVYSSSITHEQLLSFVHTNKKYIPQGIDPETGKPFTEYKYYDEYNVYTRNRLYLIDNKGGDWRIIPEKTKPIIHNIHLITEYYFNRKRMSFLEICKDIFDDINYVENLDKDDIESFVNAVMVFTNAEVTEEGMSAIKKFGAVSIKSTDQKKASVELLQSRLKSLDTQIYYLRKLQALHSILSVPQASQSGDVSNAETGKAMLTGQGFTSASIRVENEEKAFKKCDRNSLKVILRICRSISNSEIKELKVSNVDIKFSRDLSDNLLTKTQALLNLKDAQIPHEVANQIVNLFSDPVAVTKMQEAFIEEQRKISEEIQSRSQTSTQNGINEQNNNISKTQNNEEQGQ